MKKVLIFTFFIFAACSSTFAYNSDLFAIDDELIEANMTDLNELEAIVIANPAITINEVNANFGYNLEMDSYALMASKFTLDDMEWGPFLWGFLCCPVGLFVVVTNDRSTKDEKTSYWLGVGAGVVLNAIVSGIWAATVGFGSFGI